MNRIAHLPRDSALGQRQPNGRWQLHFQWRPLTPYMVRALPLPDDEKQVYAEVYHAAFHPLTYADRDKHSDIEASYNWIWVWLEDQHAYLGAEAFHHKYHAFITQYNNEYALHEGVVRAPWYMGPQQQLSSHNRTPCGRFACLPQELIHMIVQACLNGKKAQPDEARAKGVRVVGPKVYGGIHELSQVNKAFYALCFPVLSRVVFIMAIPRDLHNEVFRFNHTVRPQIKAVVRSVSIRSNHLADADGERLLPTRRLEMAHGAAHRSLPGSLLSLTHLVPNLRELDLFLHRKDVPGLRGLIGTGRRNSLPSIEAVRFMTDTHVSLAFLPLAFPNMKTLSVRVHGTGPGTGWNRSQLEKLRPVSSLKTVQLFRRIWREVDLKKIGDCFPHVERLVLMGRLYPITLSEFGNALAGLPNLRDLSVSCHASPEASLVNDDRDDAEVDAFKDFTLSGMPGTTDIKREDQEFALMALDMFKHPALRSLRVICLCHITLPETSRIYEPVRTFGAGLVGVDVVRDYLWDVERGPGPGDFWFKGHPTVLQADRERLKSGLLITDEWAWHRPA